MAMPFAVMGRGFGRLGRASTKGAGLVPPTGYVFFLDIDGYYLVDVDGYYLLGAL